MLGQPKSRDESLLPGLTIELQKLEVILVFINITTGQIHPLETALVYSFYNMFTR